MTRPDLFQDIGRPVGWIDFLQASFTCWPSSDRLFGPILQVAGQETHCAVIFSANGSVRHLKSDPHATCLTSGRF